MADAQRDNRKKLLDDHVRSIHALHENLKKETAPEHHERLAHAVGDVVKRVRALDDDDAFGSPGNAAT